MVYSTLLITSPWTPRQYVPLNDAIDQLADTALKQCVSELTAGMSSISEIGVIDGNANEACQGVGSLDGLELFTHLQTIRLANGSIVSLEPCRFIAA